MSENQQGNRQRNITDTTNMSGRVTSVRLIVQIREGGAWSIHSCILLVYVVCCWKDKLLWQGLFLLVDHVRRYHETHFAIRIAFPFVASIMPHRSKHYRIARFIEWGLGKGTAQFIMSWGLDRCLFFLIRQLRQSTLEILALTEALLSYHPIIYIG